MTDADAARRNGRGLLLALVVAGIAMTTIGLLARQPLGYWASDFRVSWVGAQTALHAPHRLYDLAYTTELADGVAGHLHAFVNPPSSLSVFLPFSLGGVWLGFALWLTVTGGLFLAAGMKAGAPWWFILLPPVGLSAMVGQATLLMGALVIGGLTFQRTRPIVAGILYGIAVGIKPQLVVLVPIALLAERRWITLVVSALVATAVAATSAAMLGVSAWLDWFSVMREFQSSVLSDPDILRGDIAPFALIRQTGHDAVLAWAFVPIGIALVWTVFRGPTSTADRILAIFGGAFLVTPYALAYELALMAPAVAIYVNRTGDRRWPLLVVACAFYMTVMFGFLSVLAALGLPVIRLLDGKSSAQPLKVQAG